MTRWHRQSFGTFFGNASAASSLLPLSCSGEFMYLVSSSASKMRAQLDVNQVSELASPKLSIFSHWWMLWIHWQCVWGSLSLLQDEVPADEVWGMSLYIARQNLSAHFRIILLPPSAVTSSIKMSELFWKQSYMPKAWHYLPHISQIWIMFLPFSTHLAFHHFDKSFFWSHLSIKLSEVFSLVSVCFGKFFWPFKSCCWWKVCILQCSLDNSALKVSCVQWLAIFLLLTAGDVTDHSFQVLLKICLSSPEIVFLGWPAWCLFPPVVSFFFKTFQTAILDISTLVFMMVYASGLQM